MNYKKFETLLEQLFNEFFKPINDHGFPFLKIDNYYYNNWSLFRDLDNKMNTWELYKNSGSVPSNEKSGVYIIIGKNVENQDSLMGYVGSNFGTQNGEKPTNGIGKRVHDHIFPPPKPDNTKQTSNVIYPFKKKKKDVKMWFHAEYVFTFPFEKRIFLGLALEAFLIARLSEHSDYITLVNDRFNNEFWREEFKK